MYTITATYPNGIKISRTYKERKFAKAMIRSLIEDAHCRIKVNDSVKGIIDELRKEEKHGR